MDSSVGLMEGATWATGRTVNKMEREYIETRMEFREKVSGTMVRKLDGLIDIVIS